MTAATHISDICVYYSKEYDETYMIVTAFFFSKKKCRINHQSDHLNKEMGRSKRVKFQLI